MCTGMDAVSNMEHRMFPADHDIDRFLCVADFSSRQI